MSIKAVELHVGVIPDTTDVLYFKGHPVYKLGYFAFTYGNHSQDQPIYGKLEWVNFQNQIFFPENYMADGFSVFLRPGIRWDAKIRYNQKDALDVEVLDQAINMAAGNLSGLRALGGNGYIAKTPTLALPLKPGGWGAPK